MSENVTLYRIDFEKLKEQSKVARAEYMRQFGMDALVVVGSTLRAHHVIAVVTVILISFGVKMFFFSAPTAEADVKNSSMTGSVVIPQFCGVVCPSFPPPI